MLVAVYGTWYDGSRDGFVCKGTEEEFRAAGHDLGQLLGELGRTAIITSFGARTIDRHVADGYIDWLGDHPQALDTEEAPLLYIGFEPQQRYSLDDESDARYRKISEQYPRFITAGWAGEKLRFNRHLAGLARADAVVVVGGADHTYMAGHVARLAHKPLIPVASFGGAGEELLHRVLANTAEQNQQYLLGRLAPPWSKGVRDTVKELLCRIPVAIIHGHGTDWMAARDVVQGAANDTHAFVPRVVKELVSAAEALAHKWEAVAGDAQAAIAVVTPDDVGALATGSDLAARARQNVWLESGWVWGKLGRKKLLLLIRGDVEIPSDFHGLVYHRYHDTTEFGSAIGPFLKGLI